MRVIKKKFRIPDMHCSACVMKLEGLEDDLPGVRSVIGSYQKQSLVVEYEDGKVNEDEIRNAVIRMGYTVEE